MPRTVKRLEDGRFEFTTSQAPKLERITIVEIESQMSRCDKEIVYATAQKESAIARKIEWAEKLAEAEAINGRV